MAVPAYEHYTPEEYLEYERQAEYKHEYIDGQIVAMTSASEKHNLITLNVGGEIRQQLKGGPCRSHPSDMRVKVLANGMYTYPDVTIVCGQPQFDGSRPDTVLNPILIVEVLSPSTENYDRGTKFSYYRTLASLQEYLLVSQDHVQVEHYVRQESGWYFSESRSLDDVLQLPSIECELEVAEVYRWVYPTIDQQTIG